MNNSLAGRKEDFYEKDEFPQFSWINTLINCKAFHRHEGVESTLREVCYAK